jgi:hypothetical protein
MTCARFSVLGLLAVFGCANQADLGGGETDGGGGAGATASGGGGTIMGGTGGGAIGDPGTGLGGAEAACKELYDAEVARSGNCCNFPEGDATVIAVGADFLELDFGGSQRTFNWLGRSLDEYFVGGEQVSVTAPAVGTGADVFIESGVVMLSTHEQRMPYGPLGPHAPELPDGLAGEWQVECAYQDPAGDDCGLIRRVHAMNVIDPTTGDGLLVQALTPTDVGVWQITVGLAVELEDGPNPGLGCDSGWSYHFSLLKLPPG